MMMGSFSESVAGVDGLDALEHHEHLHLAHSSVEVGIALHGGVHNRLVVHRRSHTHHQAEISVGIVELLAFQLSTEVTVVSLVHHIDVVSEELVMIGGVPSVAVVNVDVTVHALVIGTRISPGVEAETR